MDISFTPHELPPSGPEELLRRTTSFPRDSSADSELLKAIRSGLRGTDAFKATPSRSILYNARKDFPSDDEITWDSETVIVSIGGVIRKTWTFSDENQPVQYACGGVIEENWRKLVSTPKPEPFIPAATNPHDRPTFGPFARASMNKTDALDRKYTNTAIFVFLRSIGKMYLRNGIEYTFQLPFIVRRAWPLYPYGVLIQRVLEPYEIEEAAISGDDPLPTLFSLTSPFAEVATVGLAKSIIGGFSTQPSVVKDEEDPSKPVDSIPHSEMVLYTSLKTPSVADMEVTVTVDPSKQTLSIWRYLYQRPKDSHMADNIPHTRLRPPAQSTSLASLANAPPTLDPATTMASLMSVANGATQPASQPTRPRRNSLTRNDLTSNLDNLALGASTSGIQGVPSVDYGRMTATYWMERLHIEELNIPMYVISCWPPLVPC